MIIRDEDLKVEPLVYEPCGQIIEPNLRQSGVRVTHLPTETAVEVMLETSRMMNKRRAIKAIQGILDEGF